MIKPLSDATFVEQFDVTGEFSINNSGGHWNSLDDIDLDISLAFYSLHTKLPKSLS